MTSRARVAAICGLFVLWTHAAAAQVKATFPPAGDARALANWLNRETNLSPGAVVSIGKTSVIGLRSVPMPVSAGDGLFQVQIRSEVIDPETASEGGYLSWSADVQIDCVGRRSRASQIVNYPQRNLTGDARQGSDTGDWVTPAPGTRLYSVVLAVCDPDFRRPLENLPPYAQGAVAPAPTKPRSGAVATQKVPAKAAPAKPQSTVKTAPKQPPAPAGGPAVQISSTGTAAQARQALAKARKAYPDRTARLSDVVETATVEGATVYRALLTGFTSRTDAESLCKAMQAKGQSCFVKQRGPK